MNGARKRRPRTVLRLAVVMAMASATIAVREVQAGRPSCATVVHELDAVVGRRGSHRGDPVRVGKRLGVEPAWVMHCAQLYGRRISKELPDVSDEEREEREERWEADEPAEVAPEEGAQGEFEVIEKRRKMRATPTPGVEEERHLLESDNPPE